MGGNRGTDHKIQKVSLVTNTAIPEPSFSSRIHNQFQHQGHGDDQWSWVSCYGESASIILSTSGYSLSCCPECPESEREGLCVYATLGRREVAAGEHSACVLDSVTGLLIHGTTGGRRWQTATSVTPTQPMLLPVNAAEEARQDTRQQGCLRSTENTCMSLCLIYGTGFSFTLLITSVFLGNSRTKQFHKGLKRHMKVCFVIREKRRKREREGGRKYMTKKT